MFLKRSTSSALLLLHHHHLFLPLRSLKTLTPPTSSPSPSPKSDRDAYFAAIHHISNIVRRDFYLERTLNKLSISPTSDLVYRVLRSCPSSPRRILPLLLLGPLPPLLLPHHRRI
ncbi:pentatricopeptide repeat-containing protein, mitochondrial [Cinnamomum micranthum f. kanehirae]|uniref:Pentatricopeptide repeat-containing protein, mitochondrial n=1 Tax=Cinnamomum micranthum f. kanehirae TaxID=337451 RepID=A0A3S3MB22_9MAGN|nr:pentatricopeptide repeat-containing protein, mitochondrial [Cinnamomum micranthum f. kanehirae]